jgi:NADPH:quinone reductase-like Zn-dependent oxidoreductase
MKAIVQTVYGSPDVLQLAEVNRPAVPDNGVLIKVHATSINAGDWHLMRGTPFLIRLLFGGLRQPKITTLGMDVAGQVEAVGKDVTQFQPGDAVFGDLAESGFGGFAEYACAPASAFVLKPANISFAIAATVPAAALAALQGLRDYGKLRAGQTVLINGASGGVGSFAVQIAKAFGAEVTAVCSTAKMDMVRSLGADHMIDYTQTDITQTGQQFDLILDAAAYRSAFDYLPILTTEGTYVLVGGATDRFFQTMLLGPWITKTRHKTVKCLASKPNQADLMTLKEMLEVGQISPIIDRTYPLSEVPAAIRQLEQRQVTGKIAIVI